MKNREDIRTEGRAVFYTVLYPKFRQAALDRGYTLALHGSMASDMDLIAVAWVKDAKPVEELVQAFSDLIGNTVWKDHHLKKFEFKPYNRICYTLSIFSDWYIDFSIIPPVDSDFTKQVNECEDKIKEQNKIIYELRTEIESLKSLVELYTPKKNRVIKN